MSSDLAGTERELLLGSLRGYRAWRIKVGPDERPALGALSQNYAYVDGVNSMACEYRQYDHSGWMYYRRIQSRISCNHDECLKLQDETFFKGQHFGRHHFSVLGSYWMAESNGYYCYQHRLIRDYLDWSDPSHPYNADIISYGSSIRSVDYEIVYEGATKMMPEHTSPNASCSCGFYAWYKPEDTNADNYGRGPIVGVASYTGKMTLGTKGFRAEKSTVVALAPASNSLRKVSWYCSCRYCKMNYTSSTFGVSYRGDVPGRTLEHFEYLKEQLPGVEFFSTSEEMEKAYPPQDVSVLISDAAA